VQNITNDAVRCCKTKIYSTLMFGESLKSEVSYQSSLGLMLPWCEQRDSALVIVPMLHPQK
jgi:hypothetical protein